MSRPARLYVALSETLAAGPRLAQTAHAVSELHALHPEACAAWREKGNTVVIVSMAAAELALLEACEGAVGFREPDLDGLLTAVAVLPVDRFARRLLARAPLAA